MFMHIGRNKPEGNGFQFLADNPEMLNRIILQSPSYQWHESMQSGRIVPFGSEAPQRYASCIVLTVLAVSCVSLEI